MNAFAKACAFPRAFYAAGEFDEVLHELDAWLLSRDYRGHEPYDLLNSPYLQSWATQQPFATCFLQAGKRMGGTAVRQILRVPESRNPKALGLILAAYCDLSRTGWNREEAADRVKGLLLALRSPKEEDWCWGYDWHYVSVRGTCLPAYAPNSVASVFCAEGLLNHAETFFDSHSRAVAISTARWLATRLAKSVDDGEQVCFSYTPNDRTKIFNNSALVGAFLARLDRLQKLELYGESARRAMQFLSNGQRSDGSWYYGENRSQGWIDSFHTGYNLCALLQYQEVTGDSSFSRCLRQGYDFYVTHFFTDAGAPRYFHDRTYPIDIHACSQAVLTFCAFARFDPSALGRAVAVARWTVAHFRNPDGSFAYQIHRLHHDRTPYVRWGQAWMLHALARLRLHLTA